MTTGDSVARKNRQLLKSMLSNESDFFLFCLQKPAVWERAAATRRRLHQVTLTLIARWREKYRIGILLGQDRLLKIFCEKFFLWRAGLQVLVIVSQSVLPMFAAHPSLRFNALYSDGKARKNVVLSNVSAQRIRVLCSTTSSVV